MKNSFKTSVYTLTLLSAFTLSTKAQDSHQEINKANSPLKLSVGPEFALPVGEFGDSYSWAIGGSVQGELSLLKDQLFVTLNAGYLNYFKNDDFKGTNRSDLQLIPVKAGLKYFPITSFYIQGGAGVSFLANKSDVGATSSVVFVYAPQIGYQFNLGSGNAIDTGVRFEGNSKFTNNGNTNNSLGLRVAYLFGK